MRVGAPASSVATSARSPEALTRLELIKPGVSTAATLAHERTLAVADGLRDLVPAGSIQRGTTLAVHGSGATSFTLALIGQAVRDGAFLAVVASRSFGLAACIDFDIPLRRVVQFSLSESTSTDAIGWAKVTAAIIEGFEIVIVADGQRVTASQARQLAVRVRDRGSVLVRVGGQSWAEAPDLRFDVADGAWQGLSTGHGHLRAQHVSVQVGGRRWRGAPRIRRLELGAGGAGGVAGMSVVSDSMTSDARQAIGSAYAGSDIDQLLEAENPSPQNQQISDDGPDDGSNPDSDDGALARLDAIA